MTNAPPPAPGAPMTAEQVALAAQRQAAFLADLARQAAQQGQQFLPVPPGVTPAPPAPPAPPGAVPGAPGSPAQPPPAPLLPPGVPPEMPPPPAPGAEGLPAPAFAPPTGLPVPSVGGTPPGAVPPEGLPAPTDPQAQRDEQERQRLGMDAEMQRAADTEDEFFGEGPRPRRGSTMEHPLDRASAELRDELQANAKRLAADLFPNGPAGTVLPSKRSLGAYMRRHWDDPTFRTAMLNRMAPKGPDGTRVPWGVRNFVRLYREEVEPYRTAGPAPQPPTPPSPDQQQPPVAPALPAGPAMLGPQGPEAGLPPPTSPFSLPGIPGV